ncbi:protein-tyrosine phosphatase-like protein [Blastocladiella britannica]|nr:protein-tyrosine phosphatase-like protein [Blastocladiella britannica]
MATSPQRKYHLSAVHAPAPTSPLRFVISDCPDPSSLPEYVVALTRAAPTVRHLVRLSASVAGGAHAYDSAPLVAAGISVHDWAAFDDGGVPSAAQVAKWIAFLATLVVAAVAEDASEAPVVAVHCVSGIGRAPLLVALATVESGIDALDAVSSVRALRRGALNNVQVRWLADYRPKKTLADLKRARKAAATYSEDADDNENDSAVPPPSTSVKKPGLWARISGKKSSK